MNILKLKSAKVGPYDIFITRVKGLAAEQEFLGRYKPAEQAIELDDGLIECNATQVLLHELVHAMNFVYDLGIKNEKQVDRWATALMALLKDNNLMK